MCIVSWASTKAISSVFSLSAKVRIEDEVIVLEGIFVELALRRPPYQMTPVGLGLPMLRTWVRK
jgi:hypothetical protein